MAFSVESGTVKFSQRRTSFAERYPDYVTWLDGNVWVLDIETEIHEPLANFRSSLYYQSLTLQGAPTRTKVEKVDGRRLLYVQAILDQ